MFCPVCKSEYVEEYIRCESCNIELVDKLPEPDTAMEEMVPVLRTNNQPLLTTFETVLRVNNIPHYIRGGEAASLMPTNAVVVVPPEHVNAAQALLFETESSLEPVENEV